jgi:hypothetical protein
MRERKDTRQIRTGPDHLLIRSGLFAEMVREVTERVTGEPVIVEAKGNAYRLYRETPEGKLIRV